MTKYCVNCKHFSPKPGDDTYEYARCSAGTSENPISLVTGKPKYTDLYSLPYAQVMRITSSGKCGPDALFFEEANNV